MMEYVYAGMWFLIGLLLIWKLRKENQVFVFAGGIFLFMGAWWLADALLPQLDLFGGVYAWIFRGVMAAALIVTGLAFFRQKRRDAEQRALEEEEGGAEEAAVSPPAGNGRRCSVSLKKSSTLSAMVMKATRAHSWIVP